MGTCHFARGSAVLVRHRAQCVEECRIPKQENCGSCGGEFDLAVSMCQTQAAIGSCILWQCLLMFASDAIGSTQIPRSGGASVGVLGCRVFSMLSA